MIPYLIIGGSAFTLLSLLAIYNCTKVLKLPFARSLMIWTAAIYGGLFGSRYLYLLYTGTGHFSLLDLVVFWEGGLAWLGAPVGGAIFATILAMRYSVQPLTVLACLSPAVAVAHSVSRLACLTIGCCYGAPTEVPWAIYSKHLDAMVHPTQIYSMAVELVVGVLLQYQLLRNRNVANLFFQYLLLLSTHRFLLEAFRGSFEEYSLIYDLRFFQACSIILFAVGLVGLIATRVLQCRSLALLILLAFPLLAYPFVPRLFASAPSIRNEEGRNPKVDNPYSELEYPAPIAKHQEDQLESCSLLVVTIPPLEFTASQYCQEHLRCGSCNVLVFQDTPTSEQVLQEIQAIKQSIDSILIIAPDKESLDGAYETFIPVPSMYVELEMMTKTVTTDFIYGRLLLQDSDSPLIPVGRLPFYKSGQLKEYYARDLRDSKIVGNGETIGVVGNVRHFSGYEPIREELLQNPFLKHAVRVYQYGDGFRKEKLWQNYQGNWRWFVLIGHGTYNQFWMHQTPNPTITSKDFIKDSKVPPSAQGHLWIVGCLAAEAGRSEFTLAEAAISQNYGPLTVLAASSVNYHVSNYLLLRLALDIMAENQGIPVGKLLVRLFELAESYKHVSFQDISMFDLAVRAIDNRWPESVSRIKGVAFADIVSYRLYGDPTLQF